MSDREINVVVDAVDHEMNSPTLIVTGDQSAVDIVVDGFDHSPGHISSLQAVECCSFRTCSIARLMLTPSNQHAVSVQYDRLIVRKEDPMAERMRAYKFALDLTPDQKVLLAQYAGATRYAYNVFVAEARARHTRWIAVRDDLREAGADEATIRSQMKIFVDQAPDSAPLKPISSIGWQKDWLTPTIGDHRRREDSDEDPGWMHTLPRRVFVSGLDQAHSAWKAWMSSASGRRAGRPVGFPRFKKRGRSRDSFTIPAKLATIGAYGTTWDRGRAEITDHRHIYAGFIGKIRTHNPTRRLTRAITAGAEIRSYTISRAGHRWYISVLTRETYEPASPSRAQKNAGTVGVDLGVKAIAALSTGHIVDNPRLGRKAQRRIEKLQQAIARAQKGSNRRQRLLRRLGKAQHLLALQRRTVQDTFTKDLATGFAHIGLEDLNVAGMTSSAKGTLEAPGENVKAKAGLNRSILDVGFAEIRRQLDYKTRWYGSTLTIIDRFLPTSKTCTRCGAVKSKLPLTVRVFTCECGYEADRDINAARNIAAATMLAADRVESRNGRGDLSPDSSPLVRTCCRVVEASSPPPVSGGHHTEGIRYQSSPPRLVA